MSYTGPNTAFIKKALQHMIDDLNSKIELLGDEKTDAAAELRLSYHWDIKRAKTEMEKLDEPTPRYHEFLQKHGGTWLGNVREHIKSKFHNGERVSWGSEEFLQGPPYTVRELEMVAAMAAEGAVRDYRGRS